MKATIKVKNCIVYKRVLGIFWKYVTVATVNMEYLGISSTGGAKGKKYLITVTRGGVYKLVQHGRFSGFYQLYRVRKEDRKVGRFCRIGVKELFPKIKENIRYRITVKEV